VKGESVDCSNVQVQNLLGVQHMPRGTCTGWSSRRGTSWVRAQMQLCVLSLQMPWAGNGSPTLHRCVRVCVWVGVCVCETGLSVFWHVCVRGFSMPCQAMTRGLVWLRQLVKGFVLLFLTSVRCRVMRMCSPVWDAPCAQRRSHLVKHDARFGLVPVVPVHVVA